MNKNGPAGPKKSFSLAIALDETNGKFFEKLEDVLSRLANTVFTLH